MATNTGTDEPSEISVSGRDALKTAGLGIGSAAALSVAAGAVRAATNHAFKEGTRHDLSAHPDAS